jgi:hypothetical protein
MDRYTAFTFVMTLGLGLATVAYALDPPSDTVPVGTLENDNLLLQKTSGAGETPAANEPALPETMFENVLNGEIINIEGELFVIKDTAGKQVHIIVDADTLFADGVEDSEAFKTGDTIEAELTPSLGLSGDRTTLEVTAEDYRHARSFRVLGSGLGNVSAP